MLADVPAVAVVVAGRGGGRRARARRRATGWAAATACAGAAASPTRSSSSFTIDEVDAPAHMAGTARRASSRAAASGACSSTRGVTAVTYDWNVRTSRAWMNALAPVAQAGLPLEPRPGHAAGGRGPGRQARRALAQRWIIRADGTTRRAGPVAEALPERGGGAAGGGPRAPVGAAAAAGRQAGQRRPGPAGVRAVRGLGRLGQGRGDQAARGAAGPAPRARRTVRRADASTRSATTSCGGSGPCCPAGAAWRCWIARGTGACWWSGSRASPPWTSGSGPTRRSCSSRSRWRWRG